MERNSRLRKRSDEKSVSDKIIMYSSICVGVLTIIVIALLMYSKNISDSVKDETMTLEQIANLRDNNATNTESASTDIGKTVEDSKNEIEEKNIQVNEKLQEDTNNKVAETNLTTNSNNTKNITEKKNNLNTSTQVNNVAKSNATANNEKSNETKVEKEEEKKELSFIKPVEGDVVREYARDNLVYSNTLEEWVTHLGIDIKAEKTTIVKAAEAGKIKSIKNDPRYGLTIVIEHSNNMQTVYSNLLTSEFVVEGENVEKGQSIGTVGNTAVFEIVDEPHLHFEILKDSIQVDPSIYIK